MDYESLIWIERIAAIILAIASLVQLFQKRQMAQQNIHLEQQIQTLQQLQNVGNITNNVTNNIFGPVQISKSETHTRSSEENNEQTS